MIKVCIMNKKGGVSKTTTAMNLGADLAKKGNSVLYIDMDSQTNLSTFAQADTEGKNILGVLLEQISIDEAIQHTPFGDIVAGAANLSGADTIITETGKEYRLQEAIEQMEAPYDYLIIDTPPSLDVLTINAMTASDWVIIPAQADIFSRDGFIQLSKAIDKTRKYCNPNLKIAGILLTRYSDRNVLSRNFKEVFTDITKKMNTILFNSSIRECVAIREAQVVRKSIFDYDKKCNGSKDYSDFVDELLTVIHK